MSDNLHNLLKLIHYKKATKLKKKSPTCFDKTAVFTRNVKTSGRFFSNFCALLRKPDFYYTVVDFTDSANDDAGKTEETEIIMSDFDQQP